MSVGLASSSATTDWKHMGATVLQSDAQSPAAPSGPLLLPGRDRL